MALPARGCLSCLLAAVVSSAEASDDRGGSGGSLGNRTACGSRCLEEMISSPSRGQPFPLRGDGPWRSCVFVSNDHGAALAEWLEAVAENSNGADVRQLAVLHIDAHNDLNVPSEAAPFLGRDHLSWPSNASYRREISDLVDLADFQLASVWAGVVDRIVWVRPGYGEPEHSLDTLVLNSSSALFDLAVPVSFKPGWPEPGRDDGGQDVAPDIQRWPFYYHEIPADDLRSARGTKHVLGRLRAQPYILDIDLDFFVTDDAKPNLTVDVFAWRRASPLSECGEELRSCRHWMDRNCRVWKELEWLRGSSDGAGAQRQRCHKAFLQWHDAIFSGQQLPPGLHAAEQVLLVEELLDSPVPRNSPEVLDFEFDRLEAFLAQLAQYPPVLVTMARSAGAFTRIFDVPHLEERALAMLQRVWGSTGALRPGSDGPCASYAQGTSPLRTLEAWTTLALRPESRGNEEL